MNAVAAAGIPSHREQAVDRPDASVNFAGVSKRFDDGTLALLPVSFSVLPGELVAIVGPVRLRQVHAAAPGRRPDAPSTGTLAVDARNVGYVFQDPTLLPWRSVRRNVELLGELHGVSKPERRAPRRLPSRPSA